MHVVASKSKHLQLQDRNLLALHRAKMVVEQIVQLCFEYFVAISTRHILGRHEKGVQLRYCKVYLALQRGEGTCTGFGFGFGQTRPHMSITAEVDGSWLYEYVVHA